MSESALSATESVSVELTWKFLRDGFDDAPSTEAVPEFMHLAMSVSRASGINSALDEVESEGWCASCAEDAACQA